MGAGTPVCTRLLTHCLNGTGIDASPMMSDCREPNSSKTGPALCQLGWSDQTYASLKKNPAESAYGSHKLEEHNRLLGV